MSPHSLAGRTVLDAGAGTGAASSALTAQHARVLATDLSAGMLAWDAATRPPCAVADIRALPLADGSVDDAVAAFVLNHLTDPVPGLTVLPVLSATCQAAESRIPASGTIVSVSLGTAIINGCCPLLMNTSILTINAETALPNSSKPFAPAVRALIGVATRWYGIQ